MQPIIAELTVRDVDASLYWYQALGFAVELEGLRDEDGLQWVSLTHSGRTVWLLRAALADFPADALPRTSFYLEVPDVDALHARLAEQGLAVERAPESQWYGLREFKLRDPDGYRWVLNHPLPDDQTPPPPRSPLAGLR